MFELKDRIAVVSGGANGIGQGISRTLAKAGAKVIILDIDEEHGQATADEVGGEFYALDVTDIERANEIVQDIVKKHDRIDILAANTGIYPEILLKDMTEDDWDTIFDINVKGMFGLAKPALEQMKSQGYGRVILTSSITGPITGYPGGAAYGATKAAMLGFMRNAATEYAKFGVTINAVQPGLIATEALKRQLASLEEGGAQYIPMKKLGDPEDIGIAVAFFASEEAKYITGQNIVIDGGQILPETPDAIL